MEHDGSKTQGILSEGCPYCRILHRDVAPCPRCGGRFEFLPAQMLSPSGIRARTEEEAAAWEAHPSRAALDRLLHVLFVYQPRSLAVLESRGGPTLAELREADATMEPDAPLAT